MRPIWIHYTTSMAHSPHLDTAMDRYPGYHWVLNLRSDIAWIRIGTLPGLALGTTGIDSFGTHIGIGVGVGKHVSAKGLVARYWYRYW